MRYYIDGERGSGAPRAIVLGARKDSNNIGDNVAAELGARGWNVAGDDCAVGDGSRPPGGNIPNDEVAREHGYNVTDKGRYQRFEVPSYDDFFREDADALVITLGTTYKGHFTSIPFWEVSRLIRANLELPLEAARRFVQSAVTIDARRHEEARQTGNVESFDRIRHLILTGSYAHNHPFTNGTLYCATKAAIDMAGRTLGWELTDLGFRVHVVHPYHVQGTPMWAQVEKDVMTSKNMTYEEADAYNRKDLKMPDLLTPGEVADVIVELIVNPTFGWLSGTSVELYGGSR